GEPLLHPESVHCVAFTPDGKLLTGCNDGGVRLWDEDGKPLGAPLSHTGSVRQMALSPDGRTVVAGGVGSTVSIWKLPERQPLTPLQHQRRGVRMVAFSPDGAVCATAGGDHLYLWNARTWQLLARSATGDAGKEHKHSIEAAAFSPDSKTLLTGNWDGTARLWEVPSGKLLAML